MARYCITDFFRWEQPLINQLRKEGKFVYALRDADDGNGFCIEHRVFVNRFGFMITDEALPLINNGFHEYLNDDDFYKLGWEEDFSLETVQADISKELEEAKAEEKKREKEWEKQSKEFHKYEKIMLELERKYKFRHYCRHKDKEYYEEHWGKKWSKTTPYYENGKEIVLQYVWIDKHTKDDEQQIGYFLCDENSGRSITESRKVTVKRNCQIRTILKAIEKEEGLVRKEM